jgi:hypothetical protein
MEAVISSAPQLYNHSGERLMKKPLVVAMVILLAVAAATPAGAQNAFNRKDMVVSAGLGLGMYGLYGSSTLPPLFVAFETGVADKITVGGIAAYAGSSPV